MKVKSMAVLILLLVMGSVIIDLNAKTSRENDEITLVASADGYSKEEAIKIALRSAIEQVYGTFVSANTEMLNDEIVKDEIVTISSGNIKEYKEISNTFLPNGKYFVQIQATICLPKLIKYIKSKGGEIEFAGASFAMNLKMKEMNKNNEEIAFKNMFHEMDLLYQNGFTYEIKANNPTSNGKMKVVVEAKANENAVQAWNLFHNTVERLALTSDEIKEYQKENLPMYILENYNTSNDKVGDYVFRSLETLKSISEFFNYIYVKNMLAFTIQTDHSVSKINLLSSYAIYDDTYSRGIKNNYLRYGSSTKASIIYENVVPSWTMYLKNSNLNMMTSVIFKREYVASNELLNYITKINQIKNFTYFFYDEGFSSDKSNPQQIQASMEDFWSEYIEQSTNKLQKWARKRALNKEEEKKGIPAQYKGALIAFSGHKNGKTTHSIHLTMDIPIEEIKRISKITIH